jgi:integrase
MSRKTASPKKNPQTGLYEFIVDVGLGPDGERRQARRRGFKTLKAAQTALNALRTQADAGSYVAPRRQTLRQFVEDDWLPAVQASLEPSTLHSYRRNLKLHVLPKLGHVQLSALDPAQLNSLYAELLADGRKDAEGGALSARSVRYIATIVGKVLHDAVRWDRIVRNPAERADPPRARDAKAPAMKTWSAEQLDQFLRLTERNRYHSVWLFLATTGVRRGEALGLRWEDVDLDTATVAIRQTVTVVGREVRVGGATKTGRSRVVELDARTVAVLRSVWVQQAQERLALGAGYRDSGLLFCHPDGRPYHPERFSREFSRAIERHKLDPVRLHDLRHTWATLALRAGVPLKVVSDRLGHTTTAITADVYSHVTPGMQSDAAERVAALIFSQDA